jgi:hypothetical protein
VEERLLLLLDVKPAWARRAESRVRERIERDPTVRRRWLAAAVAGWLLAQAVLRRDQVRAVRAMLLAMVVLDSVGTYVWVATGLAREGNPIVAMAMAVYGDAFGLFLRTVWSVALVLVLSWLAERHVLARMSLPLVVVPLGAVTLIHAAALGWVWSLLLGGG